MRKRKNKSPFLVFLCCVLAAPTCGVLVGALSIPDGLAYDALLELLRPWLAVGSLLGIAHIVLRPVLRAIVAPLGCLTLGLIHLAVDVLLLYGCAYFVPAFPQPSLLYAVMTTLVINVVTTLIAGE